LRTLIITIFLAGFFLPAHGESVNKSPSVLLVFYSPGCHRCQEVKVRLMPVIEKKFSGRIQIEYRDLTLLENYKLLLLLEKQYNPNIENIWPLFFMQGHFVNGAGKIGNNLVAMISQSAPKPLLSKLSEINGINLINYFKKFTPLLIIGVGLLDGINPCAFTVIVFFISFLALQGYRKKELVFIGLSFILAVFLAYILIGLGLFAFIYRLKGFWLARKIFNISVGTLSIVVALLAAFDALKYKKTQKTQDMMLQLPAAVKNQIHKVIGMHFRKTKVTQAVTPGGIYRLIFIAFITGLLVSILEAVCTGQTYLPTITFIFNTTGLKIQALGYLLLYNIMFVVPLFIVFLLALWGVTSGQFAGFLKNRLLAIKIAMAFLFLFLGLFLIWRA